MYDDICGGSFGVTYLFSGIGMEVTPEQQFRLMYEILFSLATQNGGRYKIPMFNHIRPDGMFLEADPSDNSVTIHVMAETVN